MSFFLRGHTKETKSLIFAVVSFVLHATFQETAFHLALLSTKKMITCIIFETNYPQ